MQSSRRRKSSDQSNKSDHSDKCNTSDLDRPQKKIQDAKNAARPELARHNIWKCHNYAATFKQKFPVNDPNVPNNIDYVDMNKISKEEFERKYVKALRPCVMRNAMNHWQANEKWTKHRLLKKYRNQAFKCGEDDEGNSVKIKMKYYMNYLHKTDDDSPLYIFDANYGEHRKKGALLEDYEIPEVFQDDIFRYVSNKRRPPYRWFVFGPARSGTGIHIDPLGTSAWNALVSGYKRWFIAPTHTNPDLIKVTSQDDRYQRDEAITWFNRKLPYVLKNLPEHITPIQVIQKPGEMMYVPSGWWHTVLNLTETIAVTQNFAHFQHFDICYHKAARGRPKMTKKLVEYLSKNRPDVMKIIETVDLTKPHGQALSSSSDSSSSSSSSSSDSDDEYVEHKHGPEQLVPAIVNYTPNNHPAKKRMRN